MTDSCLITSAMSHTLMWPKPNEEERKLLREYRIKTPPCLSHSLKSNHIEKVNQIDDHSSNNINHNNNNDNSNNNINDTDSSSSCNNIINETDSSSTSINNNDINSHSQQLFHHTSLINVKHETKTYNLSPDELSKLLDSAFEMSYFKLDCDEKLEKGAQTDSNVCSIPFIFQTVNYIKRLTKKRKAYKKAKRKKKKKKKAENKR